MVVDVAAVVGVGVHLTRLDWRDRWNAKLKYCVSSRSRRMLMLGDKRKNEVRWKCEYNSQRCV